MCDVGETRLLAGGGTSGPAPASSKLLRPSCKEQDKPGNGTASPTRSTPNSPASIRRAASLEKCFSDPEFFRKQQQQRQRERAQKNGGSSSPGPREPSTEPEPNGGANAEKETIESGLSSSVEYTPPRARLSSDFPSARKGIYVKCISVVIANGGASGRSCGGGSDECDGPTNGKDIMAPVLGVPPPPPPAPHMGPDGLILPRKPYNPCLISNSHKDLHRELLFNQKIGKNVLNQKSELQRALERHKEMVSRKEAERNQEESYKNDPRTALQRAIEQRAKHIQISQQPQMTEPPNILATARARLRSRIDSQ